MAGCTHSVYGAAEQEMSLIGPGGLPAIDRRPPNREAPLDRLRATVCPRLSLYWVACTIGSYVDLLKYFVCIFFSIYKSILLRGSQEHIMKSEWVPLPIFIHVLLSLCVVCSLTLDCHCLFIRSLFLRNKLISSTSQLCVNWCGDKLNNNWNNAYFGMVSHTHRGQIIDTVPRTVLCGMCNILTMH